MMKRLIGIILAAAAVFNCTGVVAYSRYEVYLNEGFGRYRTNTYNITDYEVSGDVKIAAENQTNKALYFKGGETGSIAKSFEKKIDGDFILTFDVKSDNNAVFAKVGMKSSATKYQFISIDNGDVVMADGKKAGRIRKSSYTNVTMIYSSADQRISVIVDGKRTASNWTPYSKSSSYGGFYINKQSGAGGLYVDNIKLYSGNRIVTIADDITFNNEKEEDLHIEQDVGDYTYFHSMCISNRAGAYIFFKADEKTNKIICERYDYQNPEKGDRIILQKMTDDDVYFDVTTTKRQAGNDPDKRYKYFTLKTDILFTKTNMKGQLFMIRDATTASTRYESNTSVFNGGILTGADGSTLAANLTANTWYTYTAYVNLENSTADIYLDNELVGEAIPLNQNIKNIDTVRLSIQTGGPGEVQVRNCEITGTEMPVINGTVERTSVFPDDALIEEYLNQKNGAFNFYSQKVYYDGAKHELSAEPVYENSELYVAAEDLAHVLKMQLAVSGGKVTGNGAVLCESVNFDGRELVPVKKAAEATGKFTLDDNYGMVLIDDEPFAFDMSTQKDHWYDTYYDMIMKNGSYQGEYTELTELQQLNYFLLYDRPKAEELKETFHKINGDGDNHPRLIVNDEKIAQIKELAKTDSYYKSLVDSAIELAEADLTDEILTYSFNDNMRTNTNATRFEIRIKKLAFAYLLTGDERYAERAWKELDSVSKFPDFNFSHVIDTGMWNSGMAFGYDWIYDYLNEEQRKQLSDAIIRLGISTINRTYYAGMPSNGTAGTGSGGGIQATNAFVRWKGNYSTFVNCGVITAALAVAEDAPEICFDTIEKALQSLEYAMIGFAPDGVWIEGPNYWRTMLEDMAYSYSSLESVLGDTFGLMEAPGIEKTCRDLIGYTSANQRFSYGDDEMSSKLFFSFDSFSYFSHYFNQRDVAMMRKIKLDKELRAKYGNKMEAADPSILDVVYYIPGVTEEDLNTIERVNVMKGMESFVVHENFKDPNGLFFAAAGGPTTFYHEHNDGGDFTFDLNGESWSCIIGKGDYNVGTYDTRYSSRAEGHNTLTINPDEKLSQRAGSFAEIIDYAESDYGAYAVFDMTDLYKDAEDMKRGFYIGDNFSSVTVRDEMKFRSKVTGYWFMHTEADATMLDENTVILSKNGKSITVKVDVDKAVRYEVSIMNAEKLPSSPKIEGDGSYPNIRKIAIYFEGTAADINVQMSEITSSGSGTPISEWTAPQYVGNKENEDFSYRLYADGQECLNKGKIPVIDAGRKPEVQIVPNDSSKTARIETLAAEPDKVKIIISDNETAQERIYIAAYTDKGIDVIRSGYEILPVADYSVGSVPEPENAGPNMFDDDMTTRWTTYTSGDEVILDLGEAYNIDAVAAAFWKGSSRTYSFNVSFSHDGVSYAQEESFKSGGDSEDYEIFSTGSRQARYVKLTGLGNTVNSNTNLIELRVLKRK